MPSSNRATATRKEAARFARPLNLLDATMIVLGDIIGSGLFIDPYAVAQRVQTPFRILAVRAAGGLIALAGVALIVFRYQRPDAPRPFRARPYLLTPILFAVAGAEIVSNTFLTDLHHARIGTLIILPGVPVCFACRRKGHL